ncbi:hypothetical protein PR001_g14539 [Phytophthora rubi]|uniref:Secreted protein n=1 Tax=Phytophthora rubi TaxID=129364 RepID=A0A6A3MWG3_9STRA|nr:hypothetical protein PR001_g14539 [Phytophthora rubi]KAE9032249.1 hypothetical protein PR002_g9272 [Phytophthora rubi]
MFICFLPLLISLTGLDIFVGFHNICCGGIKKPSSSLCSSSYISALPDNGGPTASCPDKRNGGRKFQSGSPRMRRKSRTFTRAETSMLCSMMRISG